MKTLTVKQIQQVRSLTNWTTTNFHGNTKKVGHLLVSDLKAIVAKKVSRELAKIDNSKKSNVQKVRELIKWSLECRDTNYFKIMIEGNTGIYLASPVYLHSDYNKCRLFDKNEKTLKLMHLFNKIVKLKKMTTTVEKMYSNTDYPSVNGLVMAETTTHLLIDATHGGTKMVESYLKFIVRKSDGYWIKIGWNDPMNDPSNYEEGYDIIKLFQRQFGQPAEYYFYAFYGRRDWEASELENQENPKIKEILSKRFFSKKEMVEFLSSYVNEEFSFKDIGINNTHGGGIVTAHSVKQLLQKISQK